MSLDLVYGWDDARGLDDTFELQGGKTTLSERCFSIISTRMQGSRLTCSMLKLDTPTDRVFDLGSFVTAIQGSIFTNVSKSRGGMLGA